MAENQDATTHVASNRYDRDRYIEHARSNGLASFSIPNGRTEPPFGWRKVRAGDKIHDPTADLLGVHVGEPSGVVVLDIDPQNGGSLARAEELFGPMPTTFSVDTPSGGTHLYFRYPSLERYGLDQLPIRHLNGEGIDLIGDKGCVYAPTSVRAASDKRCAGEYRIANDAPFAEIPIRILAQWIGGPIGEHLTNVADTADAVEGTRDATATGRIMSSVGKAARGYLDIDVVREDYERHIPYAIKDLDRKIETALEKIEKFTPQGDQFEADVQEGLYRRQVSAEIDRRLAGTTTPHIEVLSLSDIESLPDQEWLIGGVLKIGSTAVLYAEYAAGKSFVALDWCLCVESGRDWHGRAVRPGRTLYIAAEGAHGFKARVGAWKSRFGPVDRFNLSPDPVNLTDDSIVDYLSNLVRDNMYDLVVFDTLNLVSGGEDENAATAMGKVMAAATAIRSARPGCVALILHHENRSGEIRGSSAIPSNADSLIHLDKRPNDEFTMSVRKQKDGACGKVGDFRLDLELDSMVIAPVYSPFDVIDTPAEVIERVLLAGPVESQRKLIDAARSASSYSRSKLVRGLEGSVNSGTVLESPGGQRGAYTYSLAG